MLIQPCIVWINLVVGTIERVSITQKNKMIKESVLVSLFSLKLKFRRIGCDFGVDIS